jgi:hypothetical membrane protein
MRARYPLTTIFGLLSVVAYLSLTVVSFAYYPASFSPRANWLSDLGDRLLNPQGAVFYRSAAVLAGVLLGAFFVALGACARRQGGKRAAFMIVAEALGLVAALALILTGVFPEDTGTPHSVSSAVLYVAFGTAVWFVGWASLQGPGSSRPLAYFAFCVAAATWAFAILPHAYWLEWVAVFLLLLFLGVVAVVVGREPAGMRTASDDAAD